MKKIKHLLIAGALIATGTISAQKWSEGKDLSYLKGEKEILLKFTYDNMMVGKQTESEYIKQKAEDYNKKEAGKGDAWAKSWVDDRAKVYEPKFEELFNKESEGLAGDRTKTSAKYTLIIHATSMDPGWNIGISKKPAVSDFEVMIVETANPSVIKSKGVLDNVPGSAFSGADYDVSGRMKECFAKCGKTIGKTLGKAVSK